MKSNMFVRIFAMSVLVFGVYAVAQDSPMVNITGGGATGTMPVFTGPHKIGNSIVKQSGGAINVNGGVNATGVINGSSDVDAAGNANITGAVTGNAYVLSNNFVEAIGEVYAGSFVYSPGDVESPGIFGDSFVSTPEVFSSYNATSGEGWFQNPGSGLGIGVSDVDGTQVIQSQCLAGSGYEYAAFDLNGSNTFYIDCAGDFAAAGSKSAMVPLKNKQMVKVYSQESPQVWFEDFGSGQLVGGVATVKLESKYAQLVNTKMEYHVFLTPNGDCKGLYVASKGQNSFEVRELGGGQSSVGFDYRISALRTGYEKIRLEPAKLPTMIKTQTKAPQRPNHSTAAPKR
jgi:hypothetical protein